MRGRFDRHHPDSYSVAVKLVAEVGLDDWLAGASSSRRMTKVDGCCWARRDTGRRLALIFTRRDDQLRPITCRPMRRSERRFYDEAKAIED